MATPDPAPQKPLYRHTYASLMAAVRACDRGAVRDWLNDDADPNEMSLSNVPVLVEATKTGQTGVVELLLKAKANVQAKTGLGETALHWAASRDHVDIARLLLDEKAKVDEPGYNGMTPLIVAAVMNSTDVLSLLIGKGADLTLTDDDGCTALDKALEKDNTAAIKILKAAAAAREAKAVSTVEAKAQNMERLRDLGRKHKPVVR